MNTKEQQDFKDLREELRITRKYLGECKNKYDILKGRFDQQQAKLSKITEEKIKTLVLPELNKVFDMGLKQNPFDAENSEYYLPMIDLSISKKLAQSILNLLKGER